MPPPPRATPRRRSAFIVLSLAAWAALAACQGPARVEVDPGVVQLYAPGQTARVRAVAMARNGKALPDRICQWSSSSPAVASVSAAGNSVLVTAVGQGAATVRCKVGGASGEVAVSVRVIGRLEVLPPVAELKLQDEATPFPLEVKAFDAAGQPASPRLVRTTCKDENVCRGDDRGQLWPAGAGKTRAWVEADGVATEIEVRVADARTAAGKPKAVKGNPMLEVEKAVEARDREERKAAQKKEKETKK